MVAIEVLQFNREALFTSLMVLLTSLETSGPGLARLFERSPYSLSPPHLAPLIRVRAKFDLVAWKYPFGSAVSGYSSQAPVMSLCLL